MLSPLDNQFDIFVLGLVFAVLIKYVFGEIGVDVGIWEVTFLNFFVNVIVSNRLSY